MIYLIMKDLKISRLRTFLTAFSMFVGIVAVISAVLVGTLGKESLKAVNSQLYGYSPTYSISISGGFFTDYDTTKNLIDNIENLGKSAIVINPSKEINYAPIYSFEELKEPRKILKRIINTEVIYTSSKYNEIYNLPLVSGKWFDKNENNLALNVVLNKQAYELYNSNYIAGNRTDTLNLTPFNVSGVVNDGKNWPVAYVDIRILLSYFPNLFNTENATIYWHIDKEISLEKIRSHFNDILNDSIGGKVENISRLDNENNYSDVIDMLQIGLVITALLLLFIVVLGQINIGLSSLEQRTHELLIRRALGASKYNIGMIVLSSQIFLSVIVCVIGVLFSVAIVYFAGQMLPVDSPIPIPNYPFNAAIIAIITSICTALIAGIIPAYKASRLEPALVLR